MPEIITIEGKDPSQYRQSIFKIVWEFFLSLDKFSRSFIIIALLIVMSAPLLNNLILTNKNLLKTKSKIERLEIIPNEINATAGSQAIKLLVASYDSGNKQLDSGIYYKWGTEMAESIGKLSRVGTNSAMFMPLSSGSGELNVIAVNSATHPPIVKKIKVIIRLQ